MKAWWVKNWFMLGMPVAVGLAWIFPDAGATGGVLRSEITTKLAVALVFFGQGVTLPAKALRDGASRWRLHVGVQSYTFLVFPLTGIAFVALAGRWFAPDLRMGFLLLSVLPSTIVMSVMLTTVAKGNISAAIFNAVFSNVVGVFLTPLWVAVLIKAGGQMQSLGGIMREVLLLLILPLVVGQVVRRWGAESWADARRKPISHVSNTVILIIVYAAFCNSVKAQVWSNHGWTTFGAAAVGVAVLLAISLGGAMWVARLARYDAADAIVMVFCGAQKSLATGVPLAKIIFGAHPGLGLMLLPIMIYHPLQLFVCGAIGGRAAREKTGNEGSI